MYCKNCGVQMNDTQDICLACGVAKGKGNAFCGNCGNAVSPEASFCLNCGVALNPNQEPAATEAAEPKSALDAEALKTVQPRDIVKAIIFSIITCGIYSIYWFIVLTNEVNRITKRENEFSGGIAYVLTLLTCGIFGYYWAYKMGEKVDVITDTKNSYTGIIYLVLMVFGLGIVNYALIQDAVNKVVENQD